ncbi:MAG: hypothetical protein ACI8RD_004911, partial [Bacillariaceae sp.]
PSKILLYPLLIRNLLSPTKDDLLHHHIDEAMNLVQNNIHAIMHAIEFVHVLSTYFFVPYPIPYAPILYIYSFVFAAITLSCFGSLVLSFASSCIIFLGCNKLKKINI